MATTLDQVISSLNSVYQPQLDSVAKQQAALPAQFDAQSQGLDAQKNDAFNSILTGARARGTGVAFGGIPLQEQAQYTASTYAPAKANLLNTQDQQYSSLQDAINKINADKFSQANNIYQFQTAQDLEQQKLAEQQREFDANLAQTKASAGSGNGLGAAFSGLGGGGGGSPTTAPSGNAPQYIGNNDLRGHLNYLAQNGNNDAKIALQYVGNDGRYSLSPYVTNPAILAALNRLGAVNVYKASTGSTKSAATKPVGGTGTNYLGGSTAGIGKF